MLIDRADFADLTELAAHRQAQSERQREYVAACSPLHRRVWARAEPPRQLEALAELPLVDKEMLRESQRARPPFGDYLAAVEDRIVRVHRVGSASARLGIGRGVAEESAAPAAEDVKHRPHAKRARHGRDEPDHGRAPPTAKQSLRIGPTVDSRSSSGEVGNERSTPCPAERRSANGSRRDGLPLFRLPGRYGRRRGGNGMLA